MGMTSDEQVEPAELKKVFEAGGLTLHYQPQVDIRQRWPRIVGYEALMRWPCPDGGFIPPARFIPVAEESGLILPLDLWAIERACVEMRRLPATRAFNPRVSVNVSTQHFRDRDFARSVAAILKRTRLDPGRLTLEVTETVLMEQAETALENIAALRETGVSLSLDDFGTGYSSLAYLKTLPVQEIKLDRSFAQDLPGWPPDETPYRGPDSLPILFMGGGDAVIVSAAIEMAAGLGLRVVAEGVEAARQVSWLRQAGCQSIQGFLYGRPAPLS